jgi:hypothetical protein
MPEKPKDSVSSTASNPHEKAQPWKSFWPLEGTSPTRTVSEVSCASPEHTAKYWYALERGGLIAEQEKKLALVMQTSFDNKPWYSDREEDWDGLSPADKIRRLGGCPHCGGGSGSCTCGRVFEGG